MTGRVREWCERVLGLMRRRQPDRDLEAEIAAHIDMAVEDNLRSGMGAEEARRAAMIRFGSRDCAKEEVRDQRGLQLLESFFKDVRYALRGMHRSPGFTAVVVLTLALGIGANTAIFSLVEAVMLRDLPVRDPQRLFLLKSVGSNLPKWAPPYPCFERLREQTQAFEGLTAFVAMELDVIVDGRAEHIPGELASSNYFDLLGVKPAIGRLLTAADDQLQPPVAVISHRYWQRHFGGDPSVIGKVISYKQLQLTITGVVEEGFTGMTPGRAADVMLPFTVQGPRMLRERWNWGYDAVARLRPGASIEQAQTQVDAVFQTYLAEVSPATGRDPHNHVALAAAGKGLNTLRSRFSKPLLALTALVGLVLLVGCANLASLLIARADSRQREFAVRIAIGAGRLRLLQQLISEILLLFTFGATCGIGFALWATRLVTRFMAVDGGPVVIEPHLNAGVMVFTACVTLLAALIAGVLPVLGAVRAASHSALHGSMNRTTDSPARMSIRQMLVVTQVTLSLILLIGTGLFVRTLANLDSLDPGFRARGVLMLNIAPVLYMTPSGLSYTDERTDIVWAELLRRVRAMPEVRSASLAYLTPLSGRDRGVMVRVPGTDADPDIVLNHVSDGYFETFGIRVLAGRTFAVGDRAGAPKAAILNQAAAKFYFGDRSPIGSRIQIRGGRVDEYEIVGVVGDVKHLSLREETPRFIYIPLAQRRDPLRRLTLAIQTSGSPPALAISVEREVRQIGADILVSDVTTAERQLENSLRQERLLSTLSGFFGLLALTLSAVGLFGLIAHIVQQRTAEIGIRIALGAGPSSVVWMILRRNLLLVAVGVGAGVPTALIAVRPLESLLYGLKTTDAATVAMGVILMSVTAVTASYIPARRASRIDPIAALRND